MKKCKILCLSCFVWFLAALPALAEENTIYEIGVRGGLSDSRNQEDFTAAEVYLLKTLFGGKSLSKAIMIKARFDIGAGYLEAADHEGGYLAAGGDLVFVLIKENIDFEIGFRPTWLPEYEFGDDNMGGQIQFTTHAGLSFVWSSVVFTYRFQHTSNAGFYDENPGPNLHMFGLGYRF